MLASVQQPFGAVQPQAPPFPESYFAGTLRLTLPASACAVAAGLFFGTAAGLPAGRPGIQLVFAALAVLALVPVASAAWRGYRNEQLRREWLRQFRSRLRPSTLRKRLAAEADRYVVHVRAYAGHAPESVVEDRETGVLLAVDPPDPDIETLCTRYSAAIVFHER